MSSCLNITRNMLMIFSKRIGPAMVYAEEEVHFTLVLMVCSFRDSAGELPWYIP